MTTLNPCRKCGGHPIRKIRDYGPCEHYRKWIECQSCGHSTSVHLTSNIDSKPADAEWNGGNNE